jgi:UDP-N-acetylmuramate--alanine ligase
VSWDGRRLHFIGVGGAGMSGLALVARELGAEVSGSDRASSAYSERLRAAGIDIRDGHAAENVPAGADVVYSTAVPADNAERAHARAQGLRELHRADLLGELTRLRRTIAVSGTHGKTTTTAMALHALRGAGIDAGYVLGAEIAPGEPNAAWGSGEWLVVEADESDRSLLKLAAEIAVLTNAELDHHSTYASWDELAGTFREFLAGAGETVVWDRPALRALCPGGAPTVAYDVGEAGLAPDGVRFDWDGIAVALAVPGLHNALNARAALEAARLAGADPQRAARGIAGFRGAGRRFERLGETASGAAVYDDYAHHPTEVAATIAAARTLAPRRVVAVFQPHLFSRTRALAREFGAALAAADAVCLLDVYPARERAEDFPGVSGLQIARAAADAGGGRPVAWLPGFDAAEQLLRAQLRAGDLCLVMGAGDVDALGRRLVGR